MKTKKLKKLKAKIKKLKEMLKEQDQVLASYARPTTTAHFFDYGVPNVR